MSVGESYQENKGRDTPQAASRTSTIRILKSDTIKGVQKTCMPFSGNRVFIFRRH